MEEEICVQVTQTDDPWLLFLTSEYVGKYVSCTIYLNDTNYIAFVTLLIGLAPKADTLIGRLR